MASAEKKGKDELKDQQVMGSNANGAEGAEGDRHIRRAADHLENARW